MPATLDRRLGERCAACGGDELRVHLEVAGRLDGQGLIPTTSQFGTALGDIVRCRRCGHGQVAPMPDPARIATAYAEAASFDYVAEAPGQRATAARWLARLEAHAGGPGSLLDLGCWVGYLLLEAQTRGWRAHGVEPSAFAAGFARDRLGLEVTEGDLFSPALPTRAFDAVTMNDVIEHLAEPGAAIDRTAELLVTGGIIGLLVPDAGSAVARILGRRWWSVIPTHLQYFTRGSIGVLLRRHGFDVLETVTAPKAFTVRYYVDRLSGYSPGLGRAAVAGVTRLGVADRLWAPDFRDRMAVIARRR